MTGLSEKVRPETGARESAPTHSRRRWLWGAGVLALVVLLVWMIGFSSVFGVSTVRISGTSLVSQAEVRRVAGISDGTPLIRLDTASIQRRISAIPAVRSVVVHTSYPSTVTIAVTERTAVGYRDQGGEISEVDADDVAFRTLRAAPSTLPALLSSGNDQLDSEIATVAGALSPAIAKKVARITAATSETVTLVLRDGRTVLWGGSDADADKARLLPALLGQPGRYFDISDPASVISR